MSPPTLTHPQPRADENAVGAAAAAGPGPPHVPASRKRARLSRSEPKGKPTSLLLSDYRTCWLVKTDEPAVDIEVKGEAFTVHKSILTRHSEYFAACLNRAFAEGAENVIRFDDIEPRYLGFYLGLAASYSSIVPHTAPVPSPHPQARVKRTPMRDFVEVYKLCDRFLSTEMGDFMVKCIKTLIGEGYRVLYHARLDVAQQKALMRDFADAFEALQLEHPAQAALGESMVKYFCEGIHYETWDSYMDDVMDRPRFVGQVSRGFARKLTEALNSRTKLKRKEINGPS